jgi:hypothetical protein
VSPWSKRTSPQDTVRKSTSTHSLRAVLMTSLIDSRYVTKSRSDVACYTGTSSNNSHNPITHFCELAGYAIPAVNCVSNSGINACLGVKAARRNDAPIIIQFSSGGSQFYAGKGLDTNTSIERLTAGAVSWVLFMSEPWRNSTVYPVTAHRSLCQEIVAVDRWSL